MNELIGKKIIKVRKMTKKEIESEGWSEGSTAIVLDDGSVIYASRDSEGNGAGCLFGYNKKEQFYI